MPDMKLELIKAGKGPVIYLIGDAQAAEDAALRMHESVCLAAVVPDDWNGSLSPWPAPKCFRDGDDFSGGADEFLERFLNELPAFEENHGLAGKKRAVCGYSLAGLCAVYAMYKTDVFDAAASVSGSMWFDGWIDYMEKSAADMTGRFFCLSVGDREKKTRNIRLAPVEENTKRAGEILAARGAEVEFYLNPGNHFMEPDARLGRAMDCLAAHLNGKNY